MNRNSLLLLLLFVAGAVGVYLVVGGGGRDGGASGPEPMVDAPATIDPNGAGPTVDQDPGRVDADPLRGRDPVDRTAVDDRQADPGQYAQGFSGRLVAAGGVPIGDAEVVLVASDTTNIFARMMQAEQGVVVPPVAKTTTDRLGRYRVGVPEVDPKKKFELQFSADRHADGSLQNLTAIEAEWTDVGDTELEAGISLFGRVTSAGSGAGIAGAEVWVHPPTQFVAIGSAAVREKAATTQTDAAGNYRLYNVPTGPVSVVAVASGFARVEHPDIHVGQVRQLELNFDLPTGEKIAGVVVDVAGTPIPGAKITAHAISSKTPMAAETHADSGGRFEIIGLVAGPYQLSAEARGFVRADVKPIMAGTFDEQIVLENQGSVRVRVVSKTGKRIDRYSVFLKVRIQDQDVYRSVARVPGQQVFPRDLGSDGLYTLSGIDPGGDYALEVHAKGFAKTHSRTFAIAVRTEPEIVEVTMSEGGILEGVVQGSDGQPLEGVEVRTMPNKIDDNALVAIFGALIPFKITKTSVQTDGRGRYRIPRLTPGIYQLRFAHPQHTLVAQKDYVVEEGQVTNVPDLKLSRGTVVSGTVRVGGVPTGQVKVSISAAAEPGAPARHFSAEAITNNAGKFVILKRLPPGRYQARCAQQTLGNTFAQLAQFANTQQDFSIGPGQESHQVHFALPQ